MKSLEKLVNYIRIAPHGFIPPVMGALLTVDMGFNLGLFENLSPSLQAIEVSLLSLCFAVAPAYAINGIRKYKGFRDIIKRHGIDRRHVEPNLAFYCERQAYKAAAYSHNLGEEFDAVNKNFMGEKHFTGVPKI